MRGAGIVLGTGSQGEEEKERKDQQESEAQNANQQGPRPKPYSRQTRPKATLGASRGRRRRSVRSRVRPRRIARRRARKRRILKKRPHKSPYNRVTHGAKRGEDNAEVIETIGSPRATLQEMGIGVHDQRVCKPLI